MCDRQVLGDGPEVEDQPVLRRPDGHPPAAQVRGRVGAEVRPLVAEDPRLRCVPAANRLFLSISSKLDLYTTPDLL